MGLLRDVIVEMKAVKFGKKMAKTSKQLKKTKTNMKTLKEGDVSPSPQVDVKLEKLADMVAQRIVQEAEQFLRHVYAMEADEFGANTEKGFVRDNLSEHCQFYAAEFDRDLQLKVKGAAASKYVSNIGGGAQE